MRQNKKGFTLVELLAVIVILAIIALIATPIILGVIDTAKEGAAKDSAYAYIEAVEKEIALKMVSNTSYSVPATVDGSFASVKGTQPDASSTSLTISAGQITGGTVVVDGYTFTYSGSTLTLSK